jgi:hypothetical protein
MSGVLVMRNRSGRVLAVHEADTETVGPLVENACDVVGQYPGVDFVLVFAKDAA